MPILDDPIRPFTKRSYSHRSAWARMQACMLNDTQAGGTRVAHGDLQAYKPGTKFYWSHGIEFVDRYNMATGWLESHRDSLRTVLDMDVVALEKPIPMTALTDLRARADKTEFNLTDSEWSRVFDLVNSDVVLHRQILPDPSRIVLGDSHSIARYRRDTIVLRNDGLTLHGLLRRGLGNMLNDADFRATDHLVIQAGNIDLRHHLLRFEDPKFEASALLHELREQLQDLAADERIETFEVTAPYPIEFEARRIPKKGGWYKDTPFYGSLQERDDLRKFITDEMLNMFGTVHTWPDEWFAMDPETYARECMERPQSVHLSPAKYEWDLEGNTYRGNS